MRSRLRSTVLTRDDPTGFAAPPAFGPFRVLHQIGVGALGPVFRTYEPTRDRLVAVKVFRLDITPEQARVLADELAKATEAGLFHSSIVEPVAAGIEGTVAYRAEEYVAAESLDVAMRHYAPASLDKALPFISQLAAAIDFARAAGVGHGALHPRDIFVTPDEARATGFGVVDALDRLGHRAPVRRPYSPPERIAGEPWGITADVFSLAVIAFELLTGRRPSGVGEQMGPLMGATLGSHADAIRDVLIKAMHENPADRYASAGTFATALTQAAGLESSAPAVAAIAPEATAPALVESGATTLPSGEPDIHVEAEARALEDFAAEPIEPLPGESAREVARKVIAARKRQSRERQHLEAAQTREPEPPPVPEPIVPEAIVPAAVAPLETASEPVVSEEAASEPIVSEPIVSEPIVSESIVAEPIALESVAPAPVAPAEEPAEELPAFERPAAAAGIREFAPREAEPVLRDTSDRVIGVDEFRLREVTPLRAERPRHRSHDRIVPERTIVPAASPVGSILDRGDTGVHHVPHEEPHAGRSRIAMLPLAMMLIPGLVVAYIAGYVVGSRDSRAEQTAAVQSAPPPASGALTTPGTSGQTPPKDFSEAAVAATSPPKVPSEPVAEKPVSAAPPATPAAKTGQIVVTSTPSKASVTIDGNWSGRTPLTLNRPFGNYVVRVVEKGYDVARQEVRLSAKTPKKTMDVTLRASRPAGGLAAPAAAKPAETPKGVTTGEIFVDSRPQGARVLIDGKLQGVTPLRLTNQAVGSYSVRLELTDHQPWTSTARVTPGSVARVTGSLEQIR